MTTTEALKGLAHYEGFREESVSCPRLEGLQGFLDLLPTLFFAHIGDPITRTLVIALNPQPDFRIIFPSPGLELNPISRFPFVM